MEIENPGLIRECKSCGFSGYENYCSRCGLPFVTRRISMQGLLHDVFHLFTHLDKGFLYTVKMLILAPGHMQRAYVEGDRLRYQKPFSMFFICATIAALGRYWIYLAIIKFYHSGNASEVDFLHNYMVILNIILLPLHALIIYLVFYKSKYNYAEIAVLVLYSASFFFLIAITVALFKFIWPELDTMYIEFPVLLVYNTITFINFFSEQPRWSVAIKSLVIISGLFFLIQVLEDKIIKFIS